MKELYLQLLVSDDFCFLESNKEDLCWAIMNKAREDEIGEIGSVTMRDTLKDLQDAISGSNVKEVEDE